MRSVEEQQARVTAAAVAPRPVRVAIAEAQGVLCAEEVVAERPLPGFDQAAMEGYAVRPVKERWPIVYRLIVYWLIVYWLTVYWLIVYRLVVYWLIVYWLIVYRLMLLARSTGRLEFDLELIFLIYRLSIPSVYVLAVLSESIG